jgi:hypothetical protein
VTKPVAEVEVHRGKIEVGYREVGIQIDGVPIQPNRVADPAGVAKAGRLGVRLERVQGRGFLQIERRVKLLQRGARLADILANAGGDLFHGP